jgi:hypothetical protein
MVHVIGTGIKKYKPMRLYGFDYKEGEWQMMDLYPESKVIVIHPSHFGEKEEVRQFDKIKNGLK